MSRDYRVGCIATEIVSLAMIAIAIVLGRGLWTMVIFFIVLLALDGVHAWNGK